MKDATGLNSYYVPMLRKHIGYEAHLPTILKHKIVLVAYSLRYVATLGCFKLSGKPLAFFLIVPVMNALSLASVSATRRLE